MKTSIGLVSGEGELPLILIDSLKKRGYQVVVVCFSETQANVLRKKADEVHKLKIGQFGKLIKTFKKAGVKELLFVGKVDKSRAIKVGIPDLKALSLWRKLRKREDDSILRAVVEELEKEGFFVRGPSEFLEEFLTKEGVFTTRSPSAEEWEDIKYGFSVAKELGKLDIGQCVVVKNLMTVAVEAMEGTDATILRAGTLRDECVVVKVAKPIQDLRLDLPVVGVNTVKAMIKAKAKVLALEAGKTFFLQREEALKLANEAGISIVGYQGEKNET